ncbi:hypothetical protein GQ53DRAFT_45046 [Thozetella sp. PMI_491]|nr:hypothetical protein GQ53DRAFT_45046 [Thozetella sp. PMI_491]
MSGVRSRCIDTCPTSPTMEEVPPPSYEEAVGQLSGDGARGAPAGSPPVVPPPFAARAMPLDFNVYSESATSSAVYYMGPHKVAPQFALTMRYNSLARDAKPFIIVHDGLTLRDRPLATSTNVSAGRHWDKFVITVPLLGAQSTEYTLVAVDQGTYWRPKTSMRYSVEVAFHGGERQEFQWQEIGRPADGWKLVTVGEDSQSLAICLPHGSSLTKFLKVSFQGRGRTIDYGPTWEVMAVITALTTWCRLTEMMRD